MTLPSSGAISLSAIQTEFGGANPIGLSEYYRGGGIIPATTSFNTTIPTSGLITFSNFYGTQKVFLFVTNITSVYTSYNIRDNVLAAGWDGSSLVEAIVTNSTTLSSGGSTFALRTGTFPSGSVIKIINNGQIFGRGGSGAGGSYSATGGAAGDAILLDTNLTSLDNTSGYIFGGGGGGGVSQYADSTSTYYAGGGGGQGVNGGAAGGSNVPASPSSYTAATAGSQSAAGSGATFVTSAYATGCTGGAGGTWGNAGNAGNSTSPPAVGAAGKAINLNGGYSCPIIGGNNGSQIKGAVS